MRYLLANGLEDTCRPITRNYLEALDMSLACLVDQEFASKLCDIDNESETFWKKYVGYGKIYYYVRKACKLAGLSDKNIDEHIEIRKKTKTTLLHLCIVI